MIETILAEIESIDRIELERLKGGMFEEAFAVCPNLTEANITLRHWAETAPKEIGKSHPVRVIVFTSADKGLTFCYQLQRCNVGGVSLEGWIEGFFGPREAQAAA